MNASPGKDVKALRELAALLEDALARADELNENLVAAHISQALEAARQHL